MITTEEFKNMLIEGSKGNKKDITEQLERMYSDSYLQKIIDDTYSIVEEILDCFVKEESYTFEDSNDYKKYTDIIKLKISDFEIRDELYVVSENRIISTKIMRLVFGNNLDISHFRRYSWFDDEYEDEDEDWCVYTTKITGLPVDRIDEIKQNLFSNNKLLIKKNNLN